MKTTIKYYNDENEEVEFVFPAKHEVCPKCEGHGTHLTPSIGEHAYSAEEFYESFPEEEDRQEYFQRGGIYDVTCHQCKGKNVITVIDEEACTTVEQKEHLKQYYNYLEEEARWRREEEDERRFGC